MFFNYIILYNISKSFFFRVLKINPKLNTSLKAHGKWGDIFIGTMPISWCMNILINSGFLLRVSEWQTESSIMTLRIKGKQWYWVYKFDWLNLNTGSIGLGKDVGSSQRYTQNFLKNFDSMLYKYLSGHFIRQYFLKRHLKLRHNSSKIYDDVLLKINKSKLKNGIY